MNTPNSPLRLFTAEQRLGWQVIERTARRREFPEPAPTPMRSAAWATQTAAQATAGMYSRIKLALKRIWHIAIGLGLLTAVFGSLATGIGIWFVVMFYGSVLSALGIAAHRLYRHCRSRTARKQAASRFDEEYTWWQARQQAFLSDQERRLAALPGWSAMQPASKHHINIFGGTIWGWEAFITVFGSSLICEHSPMISIDLSGKAVVHELLDLARQARMLVWAHHLPTDLAESGLLTELDTHQLIDVLLEAVYDTKGQADPGQPGQRIIDTRILISLAKTLSSAAGATVSLTRLAAALRLLLDESANSGELTDQERTSILSAYSQGARRLLQADLRRIDAYLQPLAEQAEQAERDTSNNCSPGPMLHYLNLTPACTAGRGNDDTETDDADRSVLHEVLVDWLTRRARTDTDRPHTLLIVGADTLPQRHLQRLCDTYQRHGIRLVLLHQHLREESTHLLDSGQTAFMKLVSPDEAMHAADYIGPGRRFVLSRLTSTLTGEQTHTTDPDSSSDPDRLNRRTTTRTWGATSARATGLGCSTTGTPLLCEYRVEPTVLQQLPDYAMLLTQHTPTGSRPLAVETNPDLISLPTVSLQPLPDLP